MCKLCSESEQISMHNAHTVSIPGSDMQTEPAIIYSYPGEGQMYYTNKVLYY